MLKNKKDRFQFQPWYIKLWRFRYILTIIPYFTLRIYFFHNRIRLKTCYKIAKDLALYKMNWIRDWKDNKKKLNNKLPPSMNESFKEKDEWWNKKYGPIKPLSPQIRILKEGEIRKNSK